MKLKFVLAGIVTFMVVGFAQAQDGWNWPSDEEKEKTAREYNAAYVDYMNSDQFVEATKPLSWLLANAPDLNESIYINGVKVYHGAVGAVSDEAQKRVYQDSVITVFDLRKEKFDNEARWIENKAYYGYQYFKNDKTKIADVLSTFDRVVEVNGEFQTVNLLAYYYDLVYRNYAYNKAYAKEEILSVYDKITAIADAAQANGSDVSVPTSTRDQLIVMMELIDCDFIENTLGAKLKADMTNEALANQILKYAAQYKCTSTEAFLTALELIDSKSPTFATAQIRALRYLQNSEYDQAQPILEKALTLAENDSQKADMYLYLSKVHAQLGRKSAARSAAMEAAKLDAEKSKDAWLTVAQLYMESFNDCKGGVSRAKDRSVYIAAYNAYQRAGSSSGMASAKAQFPSKEELFTEGLQPGSTINTGCWIGETVTLSTRD